MSPRPAACWVGSRPSRSMKGSCEPCDGSLIAVEMITAIVLSTLVVAIVLTGLVRDHAVRTELLDLPNARSSHVTPTPRGGGIAIVFTSLVAMGVLAFVGKM